MLYSSRNGCLFYYDSVLYSWKIADPTMLFLLGLEAVTSYDNSQSDTLTIYKRVYYADQDKLDSMDDIDEVYDSIYSYLSKIGSVEDFESYMKFNCFGLKLFLNELTGTNDDRTVPVIFKSDSNRSLLDPSNEITRLPDSIKSTYSIYDIQAQIIYNIFLDAGYYLYHSTPEYEINPSDIPQLRTKFSDDVILSLRNDITLYNSKNNEFYEERKSNSIMYRLLDYKAMYSYSLGVLYGCKCLGYSDSVIWRLRPQYWYNGNLFNLVDTAWTVFRFHWTDHIIDPNSNDDTLFEEYQNIQNNKIWNFTNSFEPSSDNYTQPSLAEDETLCFCMYVNTETNNAASEQIMYSFSTISQASSEFPGSYLIRSIDSSSNEIRYEWRSIDEKISDGDDDTLDSQIPSKGVISSKDTRLVRYIGNDPVYIYKAYSWDDNGETKYLAPKYTYNDEEHYKKFFVYTGNLGWVDYDENSIIDETHISNGKPLHRYLGLVPKQPSPSDLKNCGKKNEDNSISFASYYKCYVTDKFTQDPDSDNDSAILYGIYNRDVKNNIPYSFDEIISKKEFDANFITDVPDPSVYQSNSYYDLQETVWLFTREEDGNIYIWDHDDDQDNDKLLGYYGYSTVPSLEIILYSQDEHYDIVSTSFRTYNNYIWSSVLLDDPEGSRNWIPKSELASHVDGTTYYSLEGSTVDIYRGENKIISKSPQYEDYTIQDTVYSIYVPDNSLSEYNIIKGFSVIGSPYSPNTLYSNGLTTNLCNYILVDDYGNPLTDGDNNPLVWYDPKYHLYWNGLFGSGKWQENKPSMYNNIMYNSLTNTEIPIYVDEVNELISIDGGTAITFEEFYSNSHYGINKTTLQVFNPSVDEAPIDCYCDDKFDPEHPDNFIYCIPNITDTWLSRSEISALGYWFVDGTSTMYDGDTQEDIVYDDNHID